MVVQTKSIALTGLTGTALTIEAALSNQLPGLAIIGLPDTAIAEAKQRVRVACANSGVQLPPGFITVNLAPADLRKQGSAFDLAIAVSCVAVSGIHLRSDFTTTVHLGELSLDGRLKRPAGLLSAVIAAQQNGFTRVVVPADCAAEAALVPGIEVVSASSLKDVILSYQQKPGNWRVLQPGEGRWIAQPAAGSKSAAVPGEGGTVSAAVASGRETAVEIGHEAADEAAYNSVDIADIVGQEEAVSALAVAAAGGHNLALNGPPGVGKTLLANALVGVMPDLDDAAALEASSIVSLGGTALTKLVRRPPLIAPHHTASTAAIIGTGHNGFIKPGAITLASHGILFMDEAPEFAGSVLDSLRQPLETGYIEIHRARVRATLPAKFQLVLAANPCPCGYAGIIGGVKQCECAPQQIRRYSNKISGPLQDRIDLRVKVNSVTNSYRAKQSQTSAEMQQRVITAQERARKRLKNTGWTKNAQVSGAWLRATNPVIPAKDREAIDSALTSGYITMRGYDKILRIAWTIADLNNLEQPDKTCIAEALHLRGY